MLKDLGSINLENFFNKLLETVQIAVKKKGSLWEKGYQEIIPGYFRKFLSWIINTEEGIESSSLQKYIKDFLDIYRLGDPAYVDCWLDLVAVLTRSFLDIDHQHSES